MYVSTNIRQDLNNEKYGEAKVLQQHLHKLVINRVRRNEVNGFLPSSLSSSSSSTNIERTGYCVKGTYKIWLVSHSQ
ncbi:hypothetical protein PP707_03465 [Acetobacter pasteurianus]|nr:hypothetical protein [Acetobacter pasteurianus]